MPFCPGGLPELHIAHSASSKGVGMRGTLSMVQNTERITPPSTRSAAPLVADAASEHTYTTKFAISRVVANRLRRELGRADLKNRFWKSSNVSPFRTFAAISSSPADRVGPGRTAL